MNWSRRLADQLAVKIHAANPHHPVSLPVQRYAIETIISYTIINTVSIGIGILLEQALEVLIVLVGFSLLRLMTGGRHFSSPTACIASTIIGFNTIPLLTQYLHSTIAINAITLCSLLLCIIFAPQGKRPIVKQHQVIKFTGGMIIAVNFLVMSPVLAITFLLQSLTLIHFSKGGGKHEKN